MLYKTQYLSYKKFKIKKKQHFLDIQLITKNIIKGNITRKEFQKSYRKLNVMSTTATLSIIMPSWIMQFVVIDNWVTFSLRVQKEHSINNMFGMGKIDIVANKP